MQELLSAFFPCLEYKQTVSVISRPTRSALPYIFSTVSWLTILEFYELAGLYLGSGHPYGKAQVTLQSTEVTNKSFEPVSNIKWAS